MPCRLQLHLHDSGLRKARQTRFNNLGHPVLQQQQGRLGPFSPLPAAKAAVLLGGREQRAAPSVAASKELPQLAGGVV